MEAHDAKRSQHWTSRIRSKYGDDTRSCADLVPLEPHVNKANVQNTSKGKIIKYMIGQNQNHPIFKLACCHRNSYITMKLIVLNLIALRIATYIHHPNRNPITDNLQRHGLSSRSLPPKCPHHSPPLPTAHPIYILLRNHLHAYPDLRTFQLLVRCEDHHRRGITQLSDARHHRSWPRAIRNLHSQHGRVLV